jgi:hypothetical protein
MREAQQEVMPMNQDAEKYRLIQQIRTMPNRDVVQAIATMRRQGWLRDGSIKGIDWSYADLRNADFSGANMSFVKLIGTNLSGCNFTRADLNHADLFEANLNSSTFVETNLSDAVLAKTDLFGTQFSGANLFNVNLSTANCLNTTFADIDLSTVKGLDTIRHLGPSTIGVDTFYRTGRPLPNTFLWGCGIPPEFTIPLPSMPALTASYFITHAPEDAAFAGRVYEALQQRGVRSWLDAKPSAIATPAARLWDRVLLCASRTSLSSNWINDELNNALGKEETLYEQFNQRVWTLIPLDVDGYMHGAQYRSPNKVHLLSRLKGNFAGWERDTLLFMNQLSQILISLGLESPVETPPPTPSQPTQPNSGWKMV